MSPLWACAIYLSMQLGWRDTAERTNKQKKKVGMERGGGGRREGKERSRVSTIVTLHLCITCKYIHINVCVCVCVWCVPSVSGWCA